MAVFAAVAGAALRGVAATTGFTAVGRVRVIGGTIAPIGRGIGVVVSAVVAGATGRGGAPGSDDGDAALLVNPGAAGNTTAGAFGAGAPAGTTAGGTGVATGPAAGGGLAETIAPGKVGAAAGASSTPMAAGDAGGAAVDVVHPPTEPCAQATTLAGTS